MGSSEVGGVMVGSGKKFVLSNRDEPRYCCCDDDEEDVDALCGY